MYSNRCHYNDLIQYWYGTGPRRFLTRVLRPFIVVFLGHEVLLSKGRRAGGRWGSNLGLLENLIPSLLGDPPGYFTSVTRKGVEGRTPTAPGNSNRIVTGGGVGPLVIQTSGHKENLLLSFPEDAGSLRGSVFKKITRGLTKKRVSLNSFTKLNNLCFEVLIFGLLGHHYKYWEI